MSLECIWGETGRLPASPTAGSVQVEPEGIRSTSDGPLFAQTLKVPAQSKSKTTQTFRL